MRFLLASYGSRGDVEPFAAVGRELLRRGHDVSIAVPPNMLGLVESAGLAAVGYGPDSQAQQGQGFVRNFWKNQNPVSAVGEVVQHVTAVWAAWGTTLTSLAKGADLLLTGANEQGVASNVAEYYGIPLAALHFFPGGHSPVGGWVGRITEQAEQAQRRALGLADKPGTVDGGSLEIQAYDEFCFPGLAAEWGNRRCDGPLSAR